MKLAEEAAAIGRRVSREVVQMADRLAEADRRRQSERSCHELRLMVVGLVTTRLGGFLAGAVANWRSGVTLSTGPAASESTIGAKAAPTPAHRSTGQSAKPTSKTAR